jgi:hypothetical protein
LTVIDVTIQQRKKKMNRYAPKNLLRMNFGADGIAVAIRILPVVGPPPE